MKIIILLILLFGFALSQEIEIGNGSTGNNAGSTTLNYTYIGASDPANESGYITEIQLIVQLTLTSDTLIVGTFSGTGAGPFTSRDLDTLIVSGTDAQVKTYNAPADFDSIEVVAGDFIGVYGTTTNGARIKVANDVTGKTMYLKSGNHFTGSPVASWSSVANNAPKIIGYGWIASAGYEKRFKKYSDYWRFKR